VKGRGEGDSSERVGWGLFLVMLGAVDLIPGTPSGSWLLGAGVILIAICAWRLQRRLKLSWFTLGLGVLTLSEGAAELHGVELPLLPIVLIVIGVRVLVGVATRERQLAAHRPHAMKQR
jgi:hypothetical protein